MEDTPRMTDGREIGGKNFPKRQRRYVPIETELM